MSGQPSDRETSIAILSVLYPLTQAYPAEMLDPCEVEITKRTPSGAGGFGTCFEGLFLGRHKVALKCSHSYVPDETAQRVRYSILVPLSAQNTDARRY